MVIKKRREKKKPWKGYWTSRQSKKELASRKLIFVSL